MHCMPMFLHVAIWINIVVLKLEAYVKRLQADMGFFKCIFKISSASLQKKNFLQKIVSIFNLIKSLWILAFG